MQSRTLDNTGTCQICGRNIKLNAGKLVRHGFKRLKGWHMEVGSCFGAGKLPYEQSCDAIALFIKNTLNPGKPKLEEILRKINASELAEIKTGVRYKIITRDDALWIICLEEYTRLKRGGKPNERL